MGITGGIGSGKSLVLRIFRALGISTYDADSRARWLTEHDPVIVDGIKTRFGQEIFDDQGKLQRKLLAEKTLHDPQALEALNAIVHPIVAKDYADWVLDHVGEPYLVKEAALLYESKSYLMLHTVVNVSCPVDTRVARVRKRDPFRSEQQIFDILARQWTDAQRAAIAEFSLDNSGEIPILRQVLALHEQFQNIDFQSRYGA